ncbi:hypothetical protein UFOVP361_127 [uncultured Caudovirales phage]|uniref:Uncharacterized protein n=1 Tax=uncultured Caudovirales phage TaxID=2100421 RepID=A0A6J7WX16_9CAUD|nr:hypothetical protein UFOVP361_127 [uncultured Caudovirales phage]
MTNLPIPPNTEFLLSQGVDIMDILHGHLKKLMYEAQGDSEDGVPSDPYVRGVYDTLSEMYRLTYGLIFAKQDYMGLPHRTHEETAQ